MISNIQKRDGRVVPFDERKITEAIYKAAESVGGSNYDEAVNLTIHVTNILVAEALNKGDYSGDNPPTVEHIQDVVEKVLIEAGHAKTAKSYILYRAERNRIREMNTTLMKTYEDITFKSAADSDMKRENANIDGDTSMGTMLKYGSEGAKQFNLMYVLPPEQSKAHIEGDIHIHDLDFFTLTTTCCQIDIIELFKNGFSTGHGHIREPNSIATYSALACIAIQSNQNDQHGGQSIPNFDYGLADGVKKTYRQLYKKNIIKGIKFKYGEGFYSTSLKWSDIDSKVESYLIDLACDDLYPILHAENDEFESREQHMLCKMLGCEDEYVKHIEHSAHWQTLERYNEIVEIQSQAKRFTEEETDKATYQAMEALVHNLNTMHSRAGAQVPFSSINYGTDTSPEGRMVIKNILLAEEAGLGNGETPIFPIHIFKVKEGVNYNPEDPNYDLFKLACRVSAKRLFPNFEFLDAPFNIQYYKPGDYRTEVATMGCRTRVIGNAYDPERQFTTGRGNLSFTSINLPRLGILANHDIGRFYEMLDEKMDLVVDQLLYRFKIQSQKKVRNYPFLMGQGVWMDSDKLDPDDTVGEVLKHGTLSMGFIGLAECLIALIGKHHGESEEAQRLGLEIITHMRERMNYEMKRTGLNFSLLATPAEGLSGTFIKKDKKKFGLVDGVTNREYYTNSFHIPVYYNIDAFSKIKLEAPYHALTNAGHISYIELDGDPQKNIDAFEQVIRCMKEQGIGYGSINHPVDRDEVCGYTGIIGDMCPRCGRREEYHGTSKERIPRIIV